MRQRGRLPVVGVHVREDDGVNAVPRHAARLHARGELARRQAEVEQDAKAADVEHAGVARAAAGQHVELDAHADHRLIEAFVAIGLAANRPITISNVLHIAKSYPQFFDDLIELGAKIERVF